MGTNSNIEWCDDTFNAWYGCTKVSPACKHCYALGSARRLGVKWGDDAERRPASERMWKQPLIWNRRAQRQNTRRRVFCSSLSDVFEDRPELDALRIRLFFLIEETPHLDWLLLTKRPENISALWPRRTSHLLEFPPNVWLGTTVEDQQRADERIPHLLRLPAAVHFLSVEPLLEPLDLRKWLGSVLETTDGRWLSHPQDAATIPHAGGSWRSGIDWVIVGGESGPRARPMHPDWARSIRDQCIEASTPVPFFFKQWGEWLPNDQKGRLSGRRKRVLTIASSKRDDHEDAVRVGKKNAGRTIDGKEWSQFPKQSRFIAA